MDLTFAEAEVFLTDHTQYFPDCVHSFTSRSGRNRVSDFKPLRRSFSLTRAFSR